MNTNLDNDPFPVFTPVRSIFLQHQNQTLIIIVRKKKSNSIMFADMSEESRSIASPTVDRKQYQQYASTIHAAKSCTTFCTANDNQLPAFAKLEYNKSTAASKQDRIKCNEHL